MFQTLNLPSKQMMSQSAHNEEQGSPRPQEGGNPILCWSPCLASSARGTPATTGDCAPTAVVAACRGGRGGNCVGVQELDGNHVGEQGGGGSDAAGGGRIGQGGGCGGALGNRVGEQQGRSSGRVYSRHNTEDGEEEKRQNGVVARAS